MPAAETPRGPRGAVPAPGGGGGQGPLQYFGQMHRVLRESEKRIDRELHKVDSTVEDKVSEATRRLADDGRRLRADTTGMFTDLEDLVLQIYEEHEAALTEERSKRAEAEAEASTHRSALVAQQGQIDALAEAMRRQQLLLDEHVNGTGAQMAAMQAESAELHKAFKAQGAAVQATKDFIRSVDEKLSSQILESARASDAAAAAAATSWEARHAEHKVAVDRFMTLEPSLRANDESNRTWRANVDEMLRMAEQRGQSASASAETILNAVEMLNEATNPKPSPDPDPDPTLALILTLT